MDTPYFERAPLPNIEYCGSLSASNCVTLSTVQLPAVLPMANADMGTSGHALDALVPLVAWPQLWYNAGNDSGMPLDACSPDRCHCGGPATPCLVMMTMTPLAASVPYSVAAAGPFSTSIDSMSLGS